MKKKLKHSKTIDTSDYILQYGAGGPVNGFIKDPQTALQENNLMWQKALAIGSLDPLAGVIDASIPLIQATGGILKEKGVFDKEGSSAASGMSTSGKRVNVEGGEILENHKGDILKIKGPKHEKGGVTLDLPMNSPEDNYNIYSDRIEGKTGKTLAREKEDREKKIARYQKHLEKFPGDIAARNTLERLIKSSKLADLNAVNLQKELRETAQMGQAEINIPEEESQTQQIPGPGESEGMLGQLTAASGISTGKNPGLGGREILDEEELLSEEDYLLSLGIDPYAIENIGENTGQVLSKEGNIEEVVMTKKLKPFVSRPVDVSVNSKFIPTNPELKDSPPLLRTDSSNSTSKSDRKNPNLGPSGFTSGDIVGALGMIKQGLASRRGAMNNLASLQPEVNKYKNYGRKAVEALQVNQSVADREYQRTLANNELDTFKNNSNIDTSSRGIGDKMSNLVALQQITNRANANAEDAYADKTVQNNAEMAKTLQAIEDKYLAEETRVQDDNMRNLDAAMEGVTQAGIDEGKMLAYLGKILNARKERDMTRDGINAQNLRVQIDKNGNYVVLPQEENNTQAVTPNKDAINRQLEEAKAKKEASEAAKTETPVTPTDTPYVTGDKTLDSFNLGTEKNNLITMLQNPKVNMKIDLGNPESIKELQRKIGNTGNNISGKFGAVTYENLKRYIAGETPIQRDPKTGIGFPKKRKK